jgi:hypothetical protein
MIPTQGFCFGVIDSHSVVRRLRDFFAGNGAGDGKAVVPLAKSAMSLKCCIEDVYLGLLS